MDEFPQRRQSRLDSLESFLVSLKEWYR